jgi:hypothetical protein
MRRGLRVALAVTATAGALALGMGSAYADSTVGGHLSKDKNRHGCDYKIDKDATLKENEFPSDHAPEAFANTTPKDAKDGHGNPYYLHNEYCQTNKPWRGTDWHDKSYDTFHYKFDKKTGFPSRDKDKNTYYDQNGYNKSFHKDRKDLERDHIGAPKNPEFNGE